MDKASLMGLVLSCDLDKASIWLRLVLSLTLIFLPRNHQPLPTKYSSSDRNVPFTRWKTALRDLLVAGLCLCPFSTEREVVFGMRVLRGGP